MIAVTGAAGFLGRHLIKALRTRQWPVRALVSPREHRGAGALRALNCEVVAGDITDERWVIQALEGCRSIVHLVAILRERGGRTFQSVNVEGTRHVVEAARRAEAERFVHLSALGAAPGANRYLRSKFEGEEVVRRSGLPFVIFRPSFVIGPGGGAAEQFRNAVAFGPWYPLVLTVGGKALFSRLAQLTPVLPVLGSGRTLFQPVDIGTLVAVMLAALEREDALNQTFDICGPDQLTYDDMMRTVGSTLGVRRIIIHIPEPIAWAIVRLFALMPNPPITADEFASLLQDNTCDNARVLAVFQPPVTPFKESIERAVA
jgi:uncharacterized protein YbjT (DUF2867 family)